MVSKVCKLLKLKLSAVNLKWYNLGHCTGIKNQNTASSIQVGTYTCIGLSNFPITNLATLHCTVQTSYFRGPFVLLLRQRDSVTWFLHFDLQNKKLNVHLFTYIRYTSKLKEMCLQVLKIEDKKQKSKPCLLQIFSLDWISM